MGPPLAPRMRWVRGEIVSLAVRQAQPTRHTCAGRHMGGWNECGTVWDLNVADVRGVMCLRRCALPARQLRVMGDLEEPPNAVSGP